MSEKWYILATAFATRVRHSAGNLAGAEGKADSKLQITKGKIILRKIS
jgi:hypothetical protein